MDLVNIDTINARNVVVNTGQFTNTEIGTSVGNLILGLGANPDSNSNTIQSGTTSIGVSNVVVASNVVNNLFAGFQAAKSATNVSETVILGP